MLPITDMKYLSVNLICVCPAISFSVSPLSIFQGFNDHQLSQLKKSEVFTKEREKEITQVNIIQSPVYQPLYDLF